MPSNYTNSQRRMTLPVLLQTTAAPSSTLSAPLSSLSEHAPGKTRSSKLRTMPSNLTPPPKLTSRLARAWSSATSPLTPLPSASSLSHQIASSDLPPPVTARLIASVALNAPDPHYLSDLSDTLSHLSVWPSVVATAGFPPSVLPSDFTFSSSSALFSAPSAALSPFSLSDESLSPTASTATPLEHIELGVTAGGSSRIPRTVQYSLAPGETAELAFLVQLGVKGKPVPKAKVVTAGSHRPASRLIRRPSVNESIHPLATIPLGRKNSSLGDPAFSRRRSNTSLQQRPVGHRDTVQPDPLTPPPNFIDAPLFDDVEEVAAPVGVLPDTEQILPANGQSQDIAQGDQENARQQPDHREEQDFEDLEMVIQPVAPQETKQEQVPQVSEETREETQEEKTQHDIVDGDSNCEEVIDLLKEEDKVEAADGDDVKIVTATGEEKPVEPLKDKKTPDMDMYLSAIRNLKRTGVSQKQIRLVPLDAGASLSGMPPAPDTAYARQGRLKERKEKGRKQADAAKERKKLADARQQEKRKKLAKRKKKKAAELRGEVYESSEEEDGGTDGPEPEGNGERTGHIQDLDAGPINVDSGMHHITEAHTGIRAADEYAHQSNKRQRLNSPGSVHQRGGGGPPFHREQRFHGNGPHGGWSGDRSGLAPNGYHDRNAYGRMDHPPRSDYNRAPSYPPPGPEPQPPYHVNRFHPPHPSYSQNPSHLGAPYSPGQGSIAYAPHSQYPPPPGAYPGSGYLPHGQSAPDIMYNANLQYSHPPYNRPGQGPFPGHPYYAERERLSRPVFNRKRDELYKTIGKEYEDLTPADGKAIDDFLDNQLYMFGPNEESKEYVLQRRPGTMTILRIRKKDGVWSVVRLKE